MANVTYSDIVTDIANEEGLPPKRLVELGRTTPGITEELFTNNVLDSLGGTYPRVTQVLERVDSPVIPTLKAVLTKLGIKEENDPTGVGAARKFVEEFPKKRDEWKKKIEKDPSFGTRGWKTVYDLFKQTSSDLMNYDIAENRRKIATGEDEEGLDWLQTKIANIVAPRVTEAIAEGKTSPEDIRKAAALDIGENAAMMVPGAGWVKGASKIPAIGKGVARAAQKVPRASELLGNAVVPVASEVTDAIVYDEGDRSEFSPEDAILGTLINQAATSALRRMASPITSRLSSSRAAAREGQGALNDLLESAGTTSRSRLADEAAATRAKVSDILRGAAPQTAKDAAAGLRAPTREEIDNALTDKAVLDLIDEGIVKVRPKKETASLLKSTQESHEAVGRALANLKKEEAAAFAAKGDAEGAAKALQEARDIEARWNMPARVHPSHVLSGLSEAIDAPNTMALTRTTAEKAFERNPGLYSVALSVNPADALRRSPSEFFRDVATGELLPYATNKAGRTEFAGSMVSPLVESKKKSTEDRKKRETIKASDVLGNSGRSDITEEDKKYLKMISKDPGVLKFSQDDGFKIWLLKRGHQLLQGTPAHRPLWEVE